MSDLLWHWIGNARWEEPGTLSLPVFRPATGDVARYVPLASAAAAQRAVAAAQEALPGWSAMPPLRRARVMFEFKRLLDAHADSLAEILSDEHGKLFADARGEVQRGIEVVEFACGIPHLLKGEFSEQVGQGVDSWSLRQPLGVCCGITPFNFPVMIPLWMFPIAIACGNTFVLKPSERDPSCPLRLAELAAEAGLPPGVLNVVNGDRDTVTALLAHPEVAAASFVGSTAVARQVFEAASAAGKRVQALGGAKNHLVVMPDADLQQAVDGIVGAAFGSAGERCMAVSVVVAVGEVADSLVARLEERVRDVRLGAGRDPDAGMGPLVTDEHRRKVAGYIDAGALEGARLAVDGRQAARDRPGFYLGATLLDRVEPHMRVYREEIFGPVLSIVRADSLEEALALIDGHEYGNGAVIFTRDGGAARRFWSAANAGMIGVNVPIPVPMSFHSFGGWKRSVFGDMAMHGMDGVRFYTRLKTVTTRWPGRQSTGVEFAMPTMR